jgi:shikimate dehydrogenase
MEEVGMIDSRTQVYGIIGNPVRHSLSPVLHNGAFGRMGLNAVYLAFEVDDLAAALSGIRGLGIRGMSVTIPHKTRIIPLLDGLEEVAEKIQAVNTIVHRGGKLIGYNTDWLGALESLEKEISLEGRKVLLLGAGGAARAIAFGLKERGAEVIIFNRSPERAASLASELKVDYRPLSSVNQMRGEVLVNATSAGMHPQEGASPVEIEVLREGMVVMDIVYQPLRTKLLREAEERGCKTVNGLEMLARQGAAQTEIWTGKRPEIKPVMEDLRRALESKAGLDRSSRSGGEERGVGRI